MATREELQKEWGPLTEELFERHPYEGLQNILGLPVSESIYISHALSYEHEKYMLDPVANRDEVMRVLLEMISNLQELYNRIQATPFAAPYDIDSDNAY